MELSTVLLIIAMAVLLVLSNVPYGPPGSRRRADDARHLRSHRQRANTSSLALVTFAAAMLALLLATGDDSSWSDWGLPALVAALAAGLLIRRLRRGRAHWWPRDGQ
ncbi:hypothetical protein [Actinoplanes sp. NPDC051494]|uniref:hypothetical protein n=1 Tax=Actinoplanes sp. NPDC051494 TaxID=3363907 RepID=UPI00379D0AF0